MEVPRRKERTRNQVPSLGSSDIQKLCLLYPERQIVRCFMAEITYDNDLKRFKARGTIKELDAMLEAIAPTQR